MNKLRTLFFVCAVGLLAACSSVSNNKINYTAPSTTPLRHSVETVRERSNEISKSLAAAKAKAATVSERLTVLEKAVEASPPVLQLAQEIHGDVDALTQILLGTEAYNTALRKTVEGAVSQIADLQEKVQGQTNLLNTANDNLNKALTQSQIDRKNAHKFKAILIGLAAAAAVAVMFGLFGVTAFVPPLLWITLGAPSAVGIVLFFWLG